MMHKSANTTKTQKGNTMCRKPNSRMTASKAAKCAIQPDGGYINPSLATCIPIEYKGLEEDDADTQKLVETEIGLETIPPMNMGTIVDYLTRFMLDKRNDRLRSSLSGSLHVLKCGYYEAMARGVWIPRGMELDSLFGRLKGLDNDSINAMCALMMYESAYRNK